MRKPMRNEFLIVSGNSVTFLGDIIFTFALNWWVIDVTNDPKILGLIMGLSVIPSLFFNLFGGVIADRFNKKLIIFLTDIISGITCVTFSFIIIDSEVNIPLVITMNVILSITHSIFSPTVRSILPRITKKDRLKTVNSVLNTITETIKITGPMLAGALFALSFISINEILLINGVSFIVSALFELLIQYSSNNEKAKLNMKSVINDFKEGFIHSKSKPVLFRLLITISLVNFFIAGYNILLPSYVNEYIDRTGAYSILLSAEAIGGVLGALILSLSKNKTITLSNLKVELTLCGIFFLPFFIINTYTFTLIATFIFGFFLVRFNTLFFTFIQTEVDQNYLGRIFSIIFTSASLFMPLGSFLFGYIIDIMNNYTFTLIGLGIVLTNILMKSKDEGSQENKEFNAV